jgi:hypothetical protein
MPYLMWDVAMIKLLNGSSTTICKYRGGKTDEYFLDYSK